MIVVVVFFFDVFGGGDIVVGFNVEEGVMFLDNILEFVEKMNEMFKYGIMVEVRVVVFLINLDKRGIVKFLKEFGVKYEYFNFCYMLKGFIEDGKLIYCGECESCVRRYRGLIEGIGEDKIVYVVELKI